jgi:hypothetical protein
MPMSYEDYVRNPRFRLKKNAPLTQKEKRKLGLGKNKKEDARSSN